MRAQWTGRVVTDTRGDAGAIVLEDESTAYDDLRDWMLDYYDVDEDEAECVAEHLTATVLTDEARQYAMGSFGLSVELDGEWSAERATQAVYDYLVSAGADVTRGRTSVSMGSVTMALEDDRGAGGEGPLEGALWRCGDAVDEILVERDVRDAAEYLRTAACD